MSLNKRKVTKSSRLGEDSRLKRCRSSLAVNLSFTNSTNSDNVSVKKYQSNKDETVLDKSRYPDKLLENNEEIKKKTHRRKMKLNHTYNSKKLSESITISKREDTIKDAQQIADTNYEILKNTILTKTKEIFHERDKCTIKTIEILDSQNHKINIRNYNQFSSMSSTLKSNHPTCKTLKNIESIQSVSNKNIAVPVNDSANKNKLIDQLKLSKKRLFTNKGAINDNIDKNFSRLTIAHLNKLHSPVIMGSRTKENKGIDSFLFHDKTKLSDMNVSNDESIGLPIVCSTFIENQIQFLNENKECDNDNRFDDPTKQSSINNIVSMEITSIQEHIPTNIQKNTNSIVVYEQDKTSNNKKTDVTVSSNKLHSQITSPPNKCNTKHQFNQIIQSKKTEIEENFRKDVLENTKNSIRTTSLSLKVNMSIGSSLTHMCNKNNEHENDNSHEEQQIPNNDSNSNYNLREPTIPLATGQESINSIQSSLQVNTSLNLINKQQNKETELQKKKNSNCKGIRKISETLTGERNDYIHWDNTSKEKKTNGSCESNVATLHNTATLQLNKSKNYVKDSQLPISRLKSQLIYNTVIPDLNKHDINEAIKNVNKSDIAQETNKSNILGESKDVTKHPIVHSKYVDNIIHSTAILGDSLLLDQSLNHQQSKEMIIEDSSDKIALDENEKQVSTENIGITHPKISRKRLLPLCESSQFSISPLEDQSLPEICEEPLLKEISKRPKKQLKNLNSKKRYVNESNCIKKRNILQLSSDDDNPNIFAKKKKIYNKPRKVISKKIVIKKYVNQDLLKKIKKDVSLNPIVVLERNSLSEFKTTKELSIQQHQYRPKKLIIVATGLSKEDKSLIKNIVKTLGVAQIELNVTKKTTHVVSTGVRTMNLLRGIIRGCWLVSLEWVLKSLESNEWLHPEYFEMAHFSKAVQENRKDRQFFGASYIPELFATCGYIHIESGTTPPCNILKELVKTAGGRITENSQNAKIIIGLNDIKETWIIDSITTGNLQPLNQYQRN